VSGDSIRQVSGVFGGGQVDSFGRRPASLDGDCRHQCLVTGALLENLQFALGQWVTVIASAAHTTP
jgi:hypothetical protein